MPESREKQEFRPDCQIALALRERGDSGKRALGCELRDVSGRAGVKYRKFLGKVDYHAAIGHAVLGALALATRLHKEKPELLVEDSGIAQALAAGLPGEKLLKEAGPEIKLKIGEFRNFRARVGSTQELALARELAERAFARD